MNTLKRQPINPKKYLLLIAMYAWSTAVWAQPLSEQQVQNIVDQQFKPLLEQYRIAGLAVGVTLNGQHYFVNYGLASKQNQQPVNNKTLFELGTITDEAHSRPLAVEIGPGEIAFTVTPFLAPSCASALVKPWMPDFAAA